jgi:uncharacterized protein (TIGR02145 family)
MKHVCIYLLVILFTGSVSSTLRAQNTGTFKDDRSGTTYSTIKIGQQWWMAENLSFRTETGWYNYNNDPQNYYLHGYLYNWEAASKACPSGWHLPSKDEFTTLVNYLGGESVAGDKLKKPLEWEISKERQKNPCGFDALPSGGYSDYYQEFNYMKVSTQFWTSTSKNDTETWVMQVSKTNPFAELWEYNKKNGASVRCIKD